MPLEFVAGATGTPYYFVVEFDGSEPYCMSLHDLLPEVKSFDQAKVWLVTPQAELFEVYVESMDGDPDYLQWQTILADGGDVIESIEYDPSDPQNLDAANWTRNVHGFDTHGFDTHSFDIR